MREDRALSIFGRTIIASLFLILLCPGAFCKPTVKHKHQGSVKVLQLAVPATSSLLTVADSGHRKHRLIAAILAFPFPFGMFGLHRLYLGASPLIPFAYIATYGGIIGVVPFMDFMLIMVCKDVNAYAHKSTLFMWSRQKKKKAITLEPPK